MRVLGAVKTCRWYLARDRWYLPLMRSLSFTDRLLALAGRAPALMSAAPASPSSLPSPVSSAPSASQSSSGALRSSDEALSPEERRLSASLMRVNHVGEVCAQALYEAQALMAQDPATAAQLQEAAREERDHLVWTQTRLEQLGASPSVLNPLWFAGALGLGLLAGRLGDKVSLGFIAETERQVEAHLAGHLQRLPEADQASRAIVARMREDEERHGRKAQVAGAVAFPWPARAAMRVAAKVMTVTAARL